VKTSMTNIWNGIVSIVTTWPAKALQWGKDLISNLVNGILGGVGAVGNAVGQIANKISSFLHFTKPDEGPLANADTYMPDFVQLLSTGLHDGVPTLQAALTQFVQPMVALGGDTGGTPALGSTSLQGKSGGGQQVIHVHVHNYLDGDELGEAITHKVATNIMSKVMTHGSVKSKAA